MSLTLCARGCCAIIPAMIVKIALLMWFVALALSFLTKAAGRMWMVRLAIGGFCLLLLAAFLKLISRVI